MTRSDAFAQKMERIERARGLLESAVFTPSQAAQVGIRINQDGSKRSAMQLLAFPDVDFMTVARLSDDFSEIGVEAARQMEREALYANYIERQKKDIAMMQRDEAQAIPADFSYETLEGLSNELKSKLIKVKPATLAQVSRIDGMTPAALTLILAKIRQSRKKSA